MAVDWEQLRTAAFYAAYAEGLQPADAEDIAQETCEKLLRADGKLVLGDRALGLVRTIARHLVIDQYRHNRYRPRLSSLDLVADYVPDEMFSDTAQQNDAQVRLAAISELVGESRLERMAQFYLDEKVSGSRGAARVRISEAKRKIKARWPTAQQIGV